MKFLPVGAPEHPFARTRAWLAIGLIAALLANAGCASSASRSAPQDQAETAASAEPIPDPEQGKLEPRYQPREPRPSSWYNDSYIFGMTRGVTDSTMHPAAKVPLLVLTIPLDIAFLPFAALGGLFG